MSRRETAQIVVQIRGAVRVARETDRTTRSQERLGDEIMQNGQKALAAAILLKRLSNAQDRLTRSSAAATVATTLNAAALVFLGGATLGIAITAMPALIAVIGAATTVTVAFTGALLGLVGAIALIGLGADQRFKALSDVAGSAANDLKAAATDFQAVFGEVTATGADHVLSGLAAALQTLQPLLRTLEPAFTALGKAIGTGVQDLARTLADLGPELGSMLEQSAGAVGPLLSMFGALIALIVRVADVAMPMLIDAISWADDQVRAFTAAFNADKVNGALGILKTAFEGIGAVIGGIAEVLGPVIGPAAEQMATTLAGVGGDAGNVLGGLLAMMVQFGQAVLPLIADGIAALGPIMKKAADSGVFLKIGKVIISAIRGAIAWVGKLLQALKPAMPFLQNVIGPLVAGIAKAIGDSLEGAIPVVRTIAEVLGWLGEKAEPIRGTIAGIGYVVGFIFGGAILKAIGLIVRLGGIIGGIVGRFGGLVGGLASLGGPVKAVVESIIGGFELIKSGISTAISWVIQKIEEFVGWVGGIPGTIISTVGSIGSAIGGGIKSGIVSAIKFVVDKINWLVRKYNKVGSLLSKLPLVPDITLSEIDVSGLGGDEPGSNGPLPGMPGGPAFKPKVRRALGGAIPGGAPYHDRIQALLTPGEHVLTREDVQAAGGHSAIHAWRSALHGQVQRFATGGPVGPTPVAAGGPRELVAEIPVYISGREVRRDIKRIELRERARTGRTNDDR